MPNRWPISSGNWSNAAIWSGSLIPTASDDVFANNFTVNIDTSFEVLTLRSAASASAVAAGGSFNFNSGSISGSVTSTTPLVPGATNLIQITATTGTVTLSLGGSVAPRNTTSDVLILHSGNCNFNITGGNNINGLQSGTATGTRCIRKTSAGVITITGNINGGTVGNTSINLGANHALNSTNGNTVVIGNVNGGTGTGIDDNKGIYQSAGTITVTGNVVGGTTGNPSSHHGILAEGTATAVTINGNITGGTGTAGISSTAPVIVTGNITGSAAAGISTSGPVVVTGNVISQGAAAGISSTSAIFINVSGSVISSATANAINATNASAVVNLAGNMVNTSGKTAIYCQNLFLSNTATTQAQFFTIGSQDRTLYSADTFPNLPSASNVRFGTTYGPGSGNTGTLRMASPQDVRSGVLTDNTTGSAILSIESLSNEVRTSTDPFARRLGNIATVDIVGNLLTAFKK